MNWYFPVFGNIFLSPDCLYVFGSEQKGQACLAITLKGHASVKVCVMVSYTLSSDKHTKQGEQIYKDSNGKRLTPLSGISG